MRWKRVWDSGELARLHRRRSQVPVAVARPGHTYRVRVRHQDNTGRWSHWSEPVEFVAGAADVSVWQDNLVISEIMYHPPEPVGAAELARDQRQGRLRVHRAAECRRRP